MKNKNTKNEFEKLISLALVDGLITDRERMILREKGISMGLSADEVDVILDARQYETGKSSPAISNTNKCASCGELLDEDDYTCPSCDAMIEWPKEEWELDIEKEKKNYSERETISSIVKEIEYTFIKNNNKNYYDTGSYPAFNWILVFITGGLYLIVLLIRKRSKVLFNPYSEVNNSFEKTIKNYTDRLEKFSKNAEIKTAISEINKQVVLISRRRTLTAVANSFMEGLACALIIFGIYKLYDISLATDKKSPAAENDIEEYYGALKDTLPSKALKYYLKLPKEEQTTDKYYNVLNTEIDSLMQAENYEMALTKANLLPSDYGNNNYDKERSYRVDKALSGLIPELIENKEFEKASAYVNAVSSSTATLLKYDIEDAIKNK